jgi:hypothetical protein
MITNEILALYQLTNDIAIDLAGKDILPSNRSEKRAIELIHETHQC